MNVLQDWEESQEENGTKKRGKFDELVTGYIKTK